MRTSRCRPSSRPARRPRSSSSPTCPGSPTDLANIQALDAYAARVDALEGIDRVEGPFAIHDPTTGALLTPEQVAALYALPAAQQPAGLDELLARYVRGSTVRLDAISPLPPSKPEATDLIPQIRADRAGRRDHHPGRRERGAAATTSWSRRPSARRMRSG